MFGTKKANNNANYDTLISVKTEIVGDIKFSGGLHVEGVVKGNLIGEANGNAVVRVSDKGRIEGNVSAPNVVINGQVKGDVHSFKYIELAKKAQIEGNLYYKMMEMVLGAQVNGQLHHIPDKAQPEPKQTQPADSGVKQQAPANAPVNNKPEANPNQAQ